MSYKTIILTEVESLSPKAAQKLELFSKAGGKVIFVGKQPHRSLAFKNAEENDKLVLDAIENTLKTKNGFLIESPEESDDFIAWTKEWFEKANLEPQVKISNPQSHLYCMKQNRGEQEVYFFVNSHRGKAVEFDAGFEAGNKIPYIWMPETGERFALAYKQDNKLEIKLKALESALVVFEPVKIDVPAYEFKSVGEDYNTLEAIWDVKFEHVNGSVFQRKMDHLSDLGKSGDEAISAFAGTLSYKTQFENKEEVSYIVLSEVNEAVSELIVNGEHLGMKWYGNHSYDVSPYMQEGTNEIEIKLTTTLANYCRTLRLDPTARAWAGRYRTPFSAGLESVVLVK